jgi:hypothetical protein
MYSVQHALEGIDQQGTGHRQKQKDTLQEKKSTLEEAIAADNLQSHPESQNQK